MVISIFKFLSRYYGISLNAGAECLHHDVKHNFKFLQSCSFKFASAHPEMVETGKIVYVSDTSGNIIPYLCPDEIITSLQECNYSKNEKHLSDCVYDLYHLEKESTYIIRKLLSLHKYNPYIYRLIKKELINRGIYDNKIHKINKEINKLEESENNDKYKRRRKIKCKKS